MSWHCPECVFWWADRNNYSITTNSCEGRALLINCAENVSSWDLSTSSFTFNIIKAQQTGQMLKHETLEAMCCLTGLSGLTSLPCSVSDPNDD